VPAGGREQQIDAPELLDGGRVPRRNRVRSAQVGRDRERLYAGREANGVGRPMDGVHIARRHAHRGALRGQGARHGEPEPLARAADHCDLALQSKVHFITRSSAAIVA